MGEKEIAKEIRDILEKNGIKVKAIYLFGSRARGDYFKDSDIDLIIVTDSLKGSKIERMKKVYDLVPPYNLDLIVVNSEELEKDIFIKSLLKNSVRLI